MMRIAGIAAATLIASTALASAADYPKRDITNIVVWSAGGGTDVVNRMVSAQMQKFLKGRINVTNKPGGVAGSNGMSFALRRPADGYTLVGISESVVTAGVMGGWDKRMNVWYPFIVGGSPDLVSVTASSPYKTLKDLIDAAKAKPDTIKAAASGAGSIHHLNLLALMKGTGAKFKFIPYAGSAPAQNAAMTGEVTVIVTSIAEQKQLILAGKLRPLAMLTADTFDVAGKTKVPSAFAAYPALTKYLPIKQAIGLAVRADAPAAVKAALTSAFKKAMATQAVKDWAKKNYYQLSGKAGPEATKEFARLESLFGWTLQELGSTKVSPAKLGIPKP